MNPFTQSLLRKIKDPSLHAWVMAWDTLTELVIRVFKGKAAGPQDEVEYADTRRWLQRRYPEWQTRMNPYWRAARIAGEPAASDPFAFLLSFERAQDFIGRWDAMQTLPAVREALNEMLADRIEMGE